MPAKIERVGKSKYRVETPNAIHAKGTSLENAKRQKRLLQAVDHGWRPTKKR
jgi:hypothetical protein